MLSRLRDYIYRRLDRHRSFSDDKLYCEIIMLFVAATTIAVHLILTVFYAFFCVWLSLSHIIVIFIVMLIIGIVGKKNAGVANIAMGLMIILSSLVTIHMVGGGSYSILYQFFVLVVLMLVPFKSKIVTIVSAITVFLFILSTYIYTIFISPLFGLGDIINAVAIINIAMSAAGIVLLILLQQQVKGVIDGYKTRKMKELQAQAYIDPLTGLYNRRYAGIFLSTLVPDTGQAAFVAVADIDDFKLINDNHGHDTGDVVLKIIAKILKDNMPDGSPVFRWGGEEFVIFIFDMTEQEMAVHLNKIRRLIQDTPMIVGNLVLRLTVTFGAAKLNAGKFEESFTAADKNMYFGKISGKNRVIISPGKDA